MVMKLVVLTVWTWGGGECMAAGEAAERPAEKSVPGCVGGRGWG